ncbi:MAG TPA: phytanoyl-CoA dioxygenase family protein [Pirellulales bacterium]|jgi:ectoine hydroxylase|nr:phytanoyl-CoA dioxygenase family protein [Pirellulales bacterium]
MQKPSHAFSPAELGRYNETGYLFVPALFDADEMGILLNYAKSDRALVEGAAGRKDATGQITKLTLWNEAGDDLYGMFSRSPRIVNRMEQLLGGEVYHYHTKMMLKEPRVGGAWEWHQDYGYWYHNGCLFPYLASCLIAVDRATRENGCLQVLVGSHNMGRVDHGKTGDQTGADMEIVTAALERLELAYIEAEPGDALFFHCNLLHRSDQNRSERPRWSLICCYNAARNNPYKESRHPRYSPLSKVSDSAIKTWTPPVAHDAAKS